MENWQIINGLVSKSCWPVNREARSVEVLRLSAEKSERTGFYGLGETVLSEALIDFRLTVAAIFV